MNWFTDILGVLGASIPILVPLLLFVGHYHGDEEIAALRTLIDLGLVAVAACALWGVFWSFYAMRASVRAFLTASATQLNFTSSEWLFWYSWMVKPLTLLLVTT